MSTSVQPEEKLIPLLSGAEAEGMEMRAYAAEIIGDLPAERLSAAEHTDKADARKKYGAVLTERLQLTERLTTEDIRRKIYDAVSGLESLRRTMGTAKIRLASMVSLVSERVYQLLKNQGVFPDGPEHAFENMTLGDVNVPETIFPYLVSIIERAAKLMIPQDSKSTKYEKIGQGNPVARELLIKNLLDPHYGFSEIPGLSEKLIEKTILTMGGMNALERFVENRVRVGFKPGKPGEPIKKGRFVMADTRYDTYEQIIGKKSYGGFCADSFKIKTTQKDLHHPTAESVHAFYNEHPVDPDHPVETWYLTPVGNPTSTAMTPEQLFSVCEAIVKRNPKAVIILDCAYVRTLRAERARKLMQPVLHNEIIRKQIFFVDSLSKSHGVPGYRAGFCFTENEEVFASLRGDDLLMSAGRGVPLSALISATAQMTEAEKKAIEVLHEHWGRKRKRLHEELIQSRKYHEIFADEQEHIRLEDLEEPMGLYLFLKLKPGVTAKDVAIRTGIMGVDVTLGKDEQGQDIRYMRFSVGMEEENDGEPEVLETGIDLVGNNEEAQ